MNGLNSFVQYSSLFEWGTHVGVKNFTAIEMLKTFQNSVIFVEFMKLSEDGALPCAVQYKTEICMRVVKKKSGGSLLQLQYHTTTEFYPALIHSLFSYVVESPWAKETGFNPESPISFGFTDTWSQDGIDLGLLKKTNILDRLSIAFLDRVTPIFSVSDYLMWNADLVLKQIKSRIMITWGVKDHIYRYNESHPGVANHLDEVGFLIGCQMSSIFSALTSVENETMLFSFDIFHTHGQRESYKQIKYSAFTTKDIVMSLRKKFKHIYVVPQLARKKRLVQLDPYGLFKDSFDLFLYWLDIAIGSRIEVLVSSGGDIDNTIRLLRGNKPLTMVQSNKCIVKAAGTDDQVNMLIHDDEHLDRLIQDEFEREKKLGSKVGVK
jgi:hypothetical protein